ncbi:MAG TPA: phenylalanine--tRNA ligase subunit alpha [Bacteroidia bacterium]|nr:phenylalanine--tRNA ligase subunit alpha [Bacteroidia bacterium]HNT79056.1 phenylalanine--tRNA ligase subunit alpha [Bacteroidia bacterium]
MTNDVKELIREVESFSPSNAEELEQFRLKFLSKKGVMNDLFSKMKQASPDQKRELGQVINELKQKSEAAYQSFKEEQGQADQTNIDFDYTLPGVPQQYGSQHPVSLVRQQILSIFSKLGYGVSDGPEMEDDWHNFTALNFPPEHPARDMQDTFFVQGDQFALRTHTSSVQIRVLESCKPPVRLLAPGRVYRNEAISARAHCLFHQVEGFYVDRKVSFADLKYDLLFFAREMFGEQSQIRLRPSYFPFTEPSAEIDVSCNLCEGKGCTVCKHSGWLEILGCGMIHPEVLKNVGIDASEYSGFAFGMGVERIAMLKYGISDLRVFFENDIRFLKQFRFEQ